MVESVKDTIKVFLDRGYLVDPEVIKGVDLDISTIKHRLKPNESGELVFFNESMVSDLISNKPLIEDNSESKVFNENGVKILQSYDKQPKKVEVQDFVAHYNNRYNSLRKILQSRTSLVAPLSISRILAKRERDSVSTIGLVYEKRYTKNDNIILTVEDNTGTINVLINNNKKELFEKCRDIVLDEVVGIKGSCGEKIIFADEIFFPDIVHNGSDFKKLDSEINVAFISDVHVGSNMFLEKEFLEFVNWLNGKSGSSEQKNVAKNVKYLVIAGDIVDGIGIYPDQDQELTILDIKGQYKRFAEFLELIRKDVKIIICPGNHDAIRLAEPQLVFDKELAEDLHKMDNVILVSNPSLVNICSSDDFEGFNILIYHGYSFDYYIDQIDSIRHGGGYDRGDLVMKFLLQKRHLAPTHGSTPIIVDSEEDGLLIDKVPDFFVSGHIHKTSISNYGITTMISGSCWQSRTAFQDKVGHHPEPGRVPVINLNTRDVKIMKFCD